MSIRLATDSQVAGKKIRLHKGAEPGKPDFRLAAIDAIYARCFIGQQMNCTGKVDIIPGVFA